MKRLLAVMLLAGCDPHYATHPVRPDDEEAWKGQPIIEIEKHGVFSTLERQERTLSDGTHWWVFQQCRQGNVECRTGTFATPGPGGQAVVGGSRTTCSGGNVRCCFHQFTIEEGRVAEYHARGDCWVNCEMRPPAVAKACRY